MLEAGGGPAAAVSEWGHVRLFSEWHELVDPAAARLLAATGWASPAPGYPTGAEWSSGYLAPLAAVLGDRVHYGSQVVGVGRKGRDLLVDANRTGQPFVIHTRDRAGMESRIEARAVIDASGTWTSPNPAGADGIPALGEHAAAEVGLLSYRIPAFDEAESLAEGHVVVVGNGQSACTAITELARIARGDRDLRITWVLRRGTVGDTFGGGDADELPARGALGQLARAAVEDGLVDLVTGFRTERIDVAGGRAVLGAEDGRVIDPADEVVVLTGFRPDLSFLSEVRLELDCRLQAPVRITADIDPNIHSCGSVRAIGAVDLVHPEPDFYIVGAKSYGRAATFLALTGYEQVRSVSAELAGDHDAARRVELRLPETGVCGGSGVFDEEGEVESCCEPDPRQPVALGLDPAAIEVREG